MSETSTPPAAAKAGALRDKRQLTPDEKRAEQLLLDKFGKIAHYELQGKNYIHEQVVHYKAWYILMALERLVRLIVGPRPAVFSEIIDAYPMAEWGQNRDALADMVISRRKQIADELAPLHAEALRMAHIYQTSENRDVLSSERWRYCLFGVLSSRIGLSLSLIDSEIRMSSEQHALDILLECKALGTQHFCQIIDECQAAEVPEESDPILGVVDDDDYNARCPVCMDQYTAKRVRTVMKCCQSKNSICKTCLCKHAYSASKGGVNLVFSCPFCRAKIDLYTEAPGGAGLLANKRLCQEEAQSSEPAAE